MHEPRWRTATIVVTVIAALEFVALAGAGVALIGNPLAKHYKVEAAAAARSRAHSTPQTPASKATLTRGATSVMVLNGNGRAGAAAAAAQRVRAHGYLLGQVGNAKADTYRRSVVMYRPGYAAEGTRLAHDLHVRIVSPLDGMRASQLSGSHLVLIVGA
jgi:LytR cell envelope-related transcriptional attenuator